MAKSIHKIALALLLTMLVLFLSTSTLDSPNIPDEQLRTDLDGEWLDYSQSVFLMRGVAVTFSDELTESEKYIWLEYLQESLDFLPQHLLTELDGLLVSFNPGNTCIEKNYLGCFTAHNFTIYVSTTKLIRPRDILKLILHEIGHAIDHKLDPRNNLFSEELHRNRNRPTPYSSTSRAEDFAESFAIYILSPEYLKTCCEARYEFLKEKIFFGREYP